MTGSNKERIEGVLAAKNTEDVHEKYAKWAHTYEKDMYAAGYHSPAVGCAFIARHVPKGAGPLLDFGAGTGVAGEFLKHLGYKDLVAVDGSAEMLEIARGKGVYKELHEVMLDGATRLPFEDDTFEAMTGFGILIPGHAPPEALDELVRVVKPGGVLVFNVSATDYASSGFKEKHDAFEKKGVWKLVDGPAVFRSLPFAVSSFESQVAVYRVQEGA